MLGLAEVQTAPVIIPGILDLMDIAKERQDLLVQTRVARILRADSWERYRHHAGGARLWAYRRAPVAPVPERHTGARIASDFGQSPTCPDKPQYLTRMGHPPPTLARVGHRPGGGGPGENFTESTGASEATGASALRFVPTWAWQEVPDGVVLRPGLEIRMDMETGRKWARMPDPEPKPAPEWTDSRGWSTGSTRRAPRRTGSRPSSRGDGRPAARSAQNETLSLVLPKWSRRLPGEVRPSRAGQARRHLCSSGDRVLTDPRPTLVHPADVIATAEAAVTLLGTGRTTMALTVLGGLPCAIRDALDAAKPVPPSPTVLQLEAAELSQSCAPTAARSGPLAEIGPPARRGAAGSRRGLDVPPAGGERSWTPRSPSAAARWSGWSGRPNDVPSRGRRSRTSG